MKKFFIALLVCVVFCADVMSAESMRSSAQSVFFNSEYDVHVASYTRGAENKICICISANEGINVYELGCFVRDQFVGSVIGFSADMCEAVVYTGLDFSQAGEVKNKIEKILK